MKTTWLTPLFLSIFVSLLTGSLRTTLRIPMAMFHGRGSIFPTEGFATSMGYPTSIPPLWAKPLDYVFLLSRLGAWASEGTVNTTVSLAFFFPIPLPPRFSFIVSANPDAPVCRPPSFFLFLGEVRGTGGGYSF